MFDVITLGSATRDVFLISSRFDKRHCDKKSGDCRFELGAKVEMDDIVLETGGGATNAAATFGRLGLRTATVTAIGGDSSGRDVLEALKDNHVSDVFVQTFPRKMTAYAAIMLTTGGERIVFVHRGASERISPNRIPWNRLKTRWFYVSSLGGDLRLMKRLLSHAEKIGAKVAWNPGSKELRHGIKKLGPFLRKVNLLNMNKEEGAMLTGHKPPELKKIMKSLRRFPKEYVIITDGRRGAYGVCDDCSVHADIIDAPRINVTGAGDAFGSGLVAGLIKKGDLRYALAVGTANATGCVQKTGAKRGLLHGFPSSKVIGQVPISIWK